MRVFNHPSVLLTLIPLVLFSPIGVVSAIDHPAVDGDAKSKGRDGKKNSTRRSKKSVFDYLNKSRRHTTFRKLLVACDLDELLKSSGPFTVFAPSDEAFNKLSSDTLSDWLELQNKAQLTDALLFHIIQGEEVRLDKKAFAVTKGMTLANGHRITLHKSAFSVNGAKVAKANLLYSNGVVHRLHRVLLPRSAKCPQI